MTQMLSGGPFRMFRLTDEPDGLGLSCTPGGVSLAGVPLLRKTQAGFVPRPDSEIACLLKAAYGEKALALRSRLSAIARALNSGDVTIAMIAAVQTETPELSPDAAARLAQADRELTKYNYNPAEPRDWHGRWTRDGSAAPAVPPAPAIETDERTAGAGNRARRVAEKTFQPGDSVSTDAPISSDNHSSRAPDDDKTSPKPTTFQETFEQKYDDLRPEDFSKKVTDFGYWLETHGRELSPAERESALAEYSFLQNRLSLWLNYEYKSVQEHGYLVSAASRLYQGATNSGLVPVGHLPPSMLDVAGTIALFDNPPPTRPRPATKPRAEELPTEFLKPSEDPRFVPIVDRETAGIVWGKGIQEQGIGEGNTGWEKYVASQNPNNKLLRPSATGFDVFNWTNGEATSAKTLDTKKMTYIKNPQEIYGTVKDYVDQVLDYERYWPSDIKPDLIKSKTIQLAVPEQTSPEQWRQLLRAIIYGKDNDVKVVITIIRG
jgi:hypothetical protein